MTREADIRVLFVCLGNICRSPTAQGVFSRIIEEEGLTGRVAIDSAGTHAYHVGKAPDPRAQTAASKRGYDLSPQRARKAEPEDFHAFDYVLAMDRENYQNLKRIAPPGLEDRLHLFLSFDEQGRETEVPDPYYGGDKGFERVLDLIEGASRGLVADIRRRL
ncbi:MAG: low molecular weight protein-tyrosine-phosphatase [Thiohalospira sp.]